jgi:DNA-binding GntR family transcriptional regulator
MALTQLKRQRASDEVYESLRQAILNATFAPGERLQVDEIAEKLGVSITPVRSAIQQLSVEGLIEIRPRSGTYVAALSVADVRQTSEIRCALECLAGELAIARLTEADLAQFRALLKAMAAPVETPKARRAHELDNTRFHKLLIACSGNRRLIEMYESLNAHLQIARLHGRDADWQERLALESTEHEEIVGALETHNVKKVQEALRRHILRASASMIATLDGAE